MKVACFAALMLCSLSFCFAADVYPSRPIRLIAASSAGSTTDFAARVIATQLSEQLGQQVIVDNRAGGGGIIGNDIVAKAAPDGYTLLQATPSFTVLPAVTKSVPYDPVRDFTGVAMMARFVNAIVVLPSPQINTLKDFIALARANPGKLNYGAQEVGSVGQVWNELFKRAAKVDIRHVPYKGGGDIATGLLRGEVQMMVGTVPTVLTLIKAGKLRALAVTTDGKRSAVLPDVPSTLEAGLNGMSVYGWQGIAVPAKTPGVIIEKLNHEIVRALVDPAVNKVFVEGAGEIVGDSPQEFTRFMREDIHLWEEVVRAAGIPRN